MLSEGQLRKRYGVSIDLSGDGKVGNKPILRVRANSGRAGIRFEGEFIDKMGGSFENVYNAAAYIGSKVASPFVTALDGGLYSVPDDSAEGGVKFMSAGEAFQMQVEMGVRGRGEEQRRASGRYE